MSGSRMSSTQVNEVLCRDEVKALVKAVNFGGIHLVFSVDGNILTLKKKYSLYLTNGKSCLNINSVSRCVVWKHLDGFVVFW